MHRHRRVPGTRHAERAATRCRRARRCGRGPARRRVGAWSGKTMTSPRASRTWCNRSAPQRILLLTFEPRGAGDGAPHWLQLLQRALGLARSPALPWAGPSTRSAHRLLREHRAGDRPPPADFTVHDRGDAEDRWLSATSRPATRDRRFPHRAPASRSTRARSMRSRPGRGAAARLPWCPALGDEPGAVRRLRPRDKRSSSTRSTTTTCCSTGGR